MTVSVVIGVIIISLFTIGTLIMLLATCGWRGAIVVIAESLIIIGILKFAIMCLDRTIVF